MRTQAIPFHSGAEAGKPVDFVVRDGDGLAQPRRDRAGLPLETVAEHAHRNVRSLAAGSLSSDAVDHHGQAARDIDMEAVFVDFTLQSRMRVASDPQRCDRFHRPAHRSGSSFVRNAAHADNPTTAPSSARNTSRAQRSAVIIG